MARITLYLDIKGKYLNFYCDPDEHTYGDIIDQLEDIVGYEKWLLAIKYADCDDVALLFYDPKTLINKMKIRDNEFLKLVDFPPEVLRLNDPTPHEVYNVLSTMFDVLSESDGRYDIRFENTRISDVPKDGSCMFHCIVECLSDTKYNSPCALRELIADTVKKYPSYFGEIIFESEFEAYCQRIQQPDEWGSIDELKILGLCFDIEFCVFDFENTLVHFTSRGIYKKRIILVYENNHYNYVTAVYNRCVTKIFDIEHNSDADDKTIKYLYRCVL